MACTLANISVGTDCPANEGGIIKSFVTSLANITGVTIASGIITTFTMASTGLWKTYDYTKDGTAYFNQVSTLNGQRLTIEQTAFLKFAGLSAGFIDAANNVRGCCQIVMIHVLANGLRVIQGIEAQSASGAPVGSNNRATRITPSVMSDVAANEARLEFTVAGNSNSFGLTTSLTDAAIAAL